MNIFILGLLFVVDASKFVGSLAALFTFFACLLIANSEGGFFSPDFQFFPFLILGLTLVGYKWLNLAAAVISAGVLLTHLNWPMSKVAQPEYPLENLQNHVLLVTHYFLIMNVVFFAYFPQSLMKKVFNKLEASLAIVFGVLAYLVGFHLTQMSNWFLLTIPVFYSLYFGKKWMWISLGLILGLINYLRFNTGDLALEFITSHWIEIYLVMFLSMALTFVIAWRLMLVMEQEEADFAREQLENFK